MRTVSVLDHLAMQPLHQLRIRLHQWSGDETKVASVIDFSLRISFLMSTVWIAHLYIKPIVELKFLKSLGESAFSPFSNRHNGRGQIVNAQCLWHSPSLTKQLRQPMEEAFTVFRRQRISKRSVAIGKAHDQNRSLFFLPLLRHNRHLPEIHLRLAWRVLQSFIALFFLELELRSSFLHVRANGAIRALKSMVTTKRFKHRLVRSPLFSRQLGILLQPVINDLPVPFFLNHPLFAFDGWLDRNVSICVFLDRSPVISRFTGNFRNR
ncbi:hypothetical protein B23_3822 [Geobacillus thermoleovorans B23]|nr:hypothetical protein B23_3822 [Geobacillus thermoleovorans B23]